MNDEDTLSDAFTKAGIKLIKETDNIDKTNDISTGYWGIGSEMPDIEAKTYDEKDINLNATKGKNTVIEVVAYWCSYCQEEESKYVDQIIKDNPDIEFIQVFADGTKAYKTTDDNGKDTTSDVIKQYYQKANKQEVPTNRTIIQENDKIVQWAGNGMHIERFPSIYFYDSTGRAAWFHEGVLTEKDFDNIKKMAFGKDKQKKLYNHLKKDYKVASDGYRGWETVKSETPEEQQNAISSLPLKDDGGEAAYYGNLYRKVNVQTKMVDLSGDVIDVPSKSGKTVYGFFQADDENLENNIEIWNQYVKVTDCATAIAVLIGDNVDKAYDSLNDKPKTTVSSAQVPTDLDDLRIVGLPEMVYVDESTSLCMGAYYGNYSLEDLQKAEKAITTFF